MAKCTFYAHQASAAEPPFDYFAFSGGKSTPVDAVRDEPTGLCFYPAATCIASQVPTGAECCDRSPWAKSLPSTSSYVFPLTLGLFLLYCYPRCKACKRRLGVENERQRRADRTRFASKWAALGALFMAIAMALSITLVSQIQEKTQTMLSVSERNGQIVAESILDPMKDIFSFLDDILLVKVGAALASNDRRQIRAVFLLGAGGGLFLGCLGAACACLVFVDAIAGAIFNPFASSNCPLAQGAGSASRTYFILGALQWPFLFTNFAFSGFAIALGDFALLGFSAILQSALQLLLLNLVFARSPNITTLGWMALLQAAIGTVFWSINLASRPGLQARMGLRSGPRVQLMSEPVQESTPIARQGTIPPGFWSDETTRLALKDGVCAMLVEISVEFSRTIALYVAAKRLGVGSFYQLSTHVSLQYTQGLAAAEGAFMNMKLQGAEMMGKGQHAAFTWLIEFVAVFAICCVLVCEFNVFYSGEALVFKYGSTACAYASDEHCLTDYAHYFGGTGHISMFSIIYTVPLAVFIKSMYKVARSSLYALQDFQYMVKVSTIGFVFVFIPAVVAMRLAPVQSPLVAVLVMMMPYLTAMLPFWFRLHGHVKELARGPPQNQQNPAPSWGRRPTTSWRPEGSGLMPDASWQTQPLEEHLSASVQFPEHLQS
mmetsp:Transcript_87116/g.172939  ORF Transcript_87116/g.172939 Transcript_87116/m.172939 type:complete len:661 (+) Transcript_87116:50-2032(+)